MSTAVFPFEVWPEGITQARIPANDNSLRSEVLSKSALTIANSAPGSPSEGDLHIVGTAWGDFSTGDVVIYKDGTWLGFEPFTGWLKYNEADNKVYKYDGGWAEFSGGGGATGIPQNSQSGDYTLVLDDANKHIYHPPADTTARTWTIPANSSVAFPVGTAITFDNDVGAGAVTIAITSDTLVFVGPGTTGSRTLASGGQATALKVSATRWRINGTGLT